MSYSVSWAYTRMLSWEFGKQGNFHKQFFGVPLPEIHCTELVPAAHAARNGANFTPKNSACLNRDANDDKKLTFTFVSWGDIKYKQKYSVLSLFVLIWGAKR